MPHPIGPPAPRDQPWPPMPGLSLIASDLDGTLLDAQGRLSARTRSVLDAARGAGVDFVAVTGRPPRWLESLADDLGPGLAVCANGALVWDLAAGRVVEADVLSPEQVDEILRLVLQVAPRLRAAVETVGGWRGIEPPEAADERAVLRELLSDGEGATKLLLHHPWLTCDQLLGVVRGAIGDLGEPTHSGGPSGLVEVSAPRVSKAATLERLTSERGIDVSTVAAFGDMPNDVAMLRWAGRSWAMSDGHPEAIAAADHLAPPNSDDGVAQVLERLLG